jgi:hypothetical protein
MLALLLDWIWDFAIKIFIFSNEDYKRARVMSREDWAVQDRRVNRKNITSIERKQNRELS